MSRRYSFVFVIVALLIASVASAQSSASATASASARILTPIALAKLTDLNFGTIVPGTGGTVTVTPAGLRAGTGGVSIITSSAYSPATFNVTGEPSTPYTISLPSSITISNGAQTMLVGAFTSNPNGTGSLSAGGSQTLAVGATLAVGNGQTSGLYTGNFTVSVAY